MKALFLSLILASPSLAQVPLKVGEMTTKAGKQYKDVTVTEKRPDGVTIMHAGGTARIGHEDLPALVRIKLGGFDEKEAAVARKAAEEKAKANEAAHEAAVKEAQKPADQGSAVRLVEAKPVAAPAIKDRDKLLVKRLSFGNGTTELEISGVAGKEPLTVTYGPCTTEPRYQSFQVAAGARVVRVARVQTKYKVTAKEAGRVVDEESPTSKTGLGGDTKLK